MQTNIKIISKKLYKYNSLSIKHYKKLMLNPTILDLLNINKKNIFDYLSKYNIEYPVTIDVVKLLDCYYNIVLFGGALGVTKLGYTKKIQVNYLLKTLSNIYVHDSKRREAKSRDFLQNMTFYDKISGKKYKIDYDLQSHYKRYYNYVSSVTSYINEEASKQNLSPVFVTLTLPSRFHPTKTLKKIKRFNNKFEYDFNNYALMGYKNLQNAFRHIHRNLTKGNEKLNIKTPYFRICEMHKDFTPHFHYVMFLPQEYFDKKMQILQDSIDKLIGMDILGKEHKIEVLKDIDRGAVYILKYLQKSLQGLEDGLDDEIEKEVKNNIDNLKNDDLYLLDGWKKINKIRLFSSSRVPLSKVNYIKILSDFTENILPKIVEEQGDKYINYYSHICHNTIRVVLKNPGENKKLSFQKLEQILPSVQVELKKNEYKYVVFELREKELRELEVTKEFAKTTIRSLHKIIDTFTKKQQKSELWDNSILSYLDSVIELQEFINFNKKTLNLVNDNLNLIKNGISKKQLKAKYKAYINKLNQIQDYFSEMQNLINETKKLHSEIKYGIGDFNLLTKKGREEWDNFRLRMKSLKEKKNKNFTKIKNSFEKAMVRILFALQDNMYSIIETKYKVLDRVIYRISVDDKNVVYSKRDVKSEYNSSDDIYCEEYDFS